MKIVLLLAVTFLLLEGYILWRYSSYNTANKDQYTTKGKWNLELDERGRILWQQIGQSKET